MSLLALELNEARRREVALATMRAVRGVEESPSEWAEPPSLPKLASRSAVATLAVESNDDCLELAA